MEGNRSSQWLEGGLTTVEEIGGNFLLVSTPYERLGSGDRVREQLGSHTEATRTISATLGYCWEQRWGMRFAIVDSMVRPAELEDD